jgi:hypothetical protein
MAGRERLTFNTVIILFDGTLNSQCYGKHTEVINVENNDRTVLQSTAPS